MGSEENGISLKVIDIDPNRRAGTRMGRRRAWVLVVVHLLIALHIAWYFMFGAALAPLEPSEASYTISEGFINAGFIFFLLLIISTMLFGRFFCGWACHVVALQDAARWVLVKLGLRPSPIRARLLMFVPLFAAFWIFGLPLIDRVLLAITDSGSGPELSLHLTTDDFWKTFPGPIISITTFLVCGFLAVCVLGSKGFCTYGCPYGGIFAIAQRTARGRIRVNDHCQQSGECTRNCSSGVDVAREVAQFGMVVDPGCMKCMDCVAGCQHDALSYSFKPQQSRQRSKAQRKAARKRTRTHAQQRAWDFSWAEELLMVGVFVAMFIIYKNLYRTVPLLLAIALASILAYLTLILIRMAYRHSVTIQRLSLKDSGRITRGGAAYLLCMAIIITFTVHSSMVQWHTTRMAHHFSIAQQLYITDPADTAARHSAAQATLHHADWLSTYALWPIRGEDRMRGELHRFNGEHEQASAAYQRELDAGNRSQWLPVMLGLSELALGEGDRARQRISASFTKRHPAQRRLQFADAELLRLQQHAAAQQDRELLWWAVQIRLDTLRRAHDQHPSQPEFATRLCDLLMSSPAAALRDPAEARAVIERATRAASRPNPYLQARLARFAFMDGNATQAAALAQSAATLAADLGDHDFATAMTEDARNYQQWTTTP